ncbi:MAG: phytochrome-like protein cph1, partial [Chitinophagaceae bacterium]
MQQQFDSDFCGSLPLSFINQIQPYGMLWVLDLESLEIVQISQNSSEYLGISHEAIIQNKLSQYTDEETIAQLRSKMSISGEKLPMTLTLAANGTKRVFHALIHHHEEYLVMELEPATAGKDSSFTSVYQEVRYIMAVIKSAATKNEVFNLAVKALKQLSGFDRIMIYEFDELWNGTVVAEVLEEGMDPYLGLRFPA